MPLPGSESSSIVIKKQSSDKHFQWKSIKKFLYFGFGFSATGATFDMFSRVTGDKISIYDFILLQIILGLSYMFMDFFIKQYSGRMDLQKNLIPLLKGVNVGAMFQTFAWATLCSMDLSDSIRYFIKSVQSAPSWTKCISSFGNFCVPGIEIRLTCRELNMKTKLSRTAANLYYESAFLRYERSILTTKFFTIAIVWICNFFITTVSEKTLVKVCRLGFKMRAVSTLFATIYVMGQQEILNHLNTSLRKIMNINSPSTKLSAISYLCYIYGIGLVGIYDFGHVSPHTATDNAVVMFSIILTLCAFMRSLVVRMLYSVFQACVEVDRRRRINTHYLLFAILPISTELIYAQRFYNIYLYLNLTVTLSLSVAILTLTTAEILHTEFTFVKNVYILGILCFLGFCASMGLCVTPAGARGLKQGMDIAVLIIAALKTAIVMWIYGVKSFSTDIHFWLGFKPTNYWTLTWSIMPIVLVYFLVRKSYTLTYNMYQTNLESIVAASWIGFTVVIVFFINIRIIAHYILHDNLSGAFKSNKKYGPHDAEERKKRANYDLSTHHRVCNHDCIILDDKFDCNHMPVSLVKVKKEVGLNLEPGAMSPEPSLTHIFEAEPRKPSSLLTVNEWPNMREMAKKKKEMEAAEKQKHGFKKY